MDQIGGFNCQRSEVLAMDPVERAAAIAELRRRRGEVRDMIADAKAEAAGGGKKKRM
jgi:hypothetical protein